MAAGRTSEIFAVTTTSLYIKLTRSNTRCVNKAGSVWVWICRVFTNLALLPKTNPRIFHPTVGQYIQFDAKIPVPVSTMESTPLATK